MKAALLIEGRDEVLVPPNEIRSFGPEKFLGGQIYVQIKSMISAACIHKAMHDIPC